MGSKQQPTGIVRVADFDPSARGDLPRSGAIEVKVCSAPEPLLAQGIHTALTYGVLGLSYGLFASVAFVA